MHRRICRQVLDCGDGVREFTALALAALKIPKFAADTATTIESGDCEDSVAAVQDARAPIRFVVGSSSEQMLNDHLVERLLVAVGDELLGGDLVKRARFIQEAETAPAFGDGFKHGPRTPARVVWFHRKTIAPSSDNNSHSPTRSKSR